MMRNWKLEEEVGEVEGGYAVDPAHQLAVVAANYKTSDLEKVVVVVEEEVNL
jgi:hypothetical protein